MKTSQKSCLAYFSFLRFKRFFFYSVLLRSLVACVTALAIGQAHAQTQAPRQDQLDYNAPWSADKNATAPSQPVDPHYQHAMDAGRTALDHHDYSKAISEAKRALKYKSHDAAALELERIARRQQADAASQAQLDKEYRKTISSAHAAFDKGNYQRALSEADRALALKPGDPDATKIKDYVERRQAEMAATAAAAKNTPAPIRVAESPTPAPAPQAPPPTSPPASETVVITPGAPPPPAVPAAQPTAGGPPSATVPVNITTAKPTRNQISASADYLLGQGNVTLPFGFSLKSLGIGFSPTVIKPSRNSDYFGGTLSYSFGQEWFIDASYAHGTSSGGFELPFGGGPSTFTIDDNWYQGYIRYAFPSLQGTHLSAYLRAGATYVTADQSDISHTDLEYQQINTAKDILGNLGFGGLYLWHPSSRIRFGVQLEGEGFFGNRDQKTQESLVRTSEIGPTVSLSDTLYGGIGRATLRFEYAIGHSRLLRAFADGGFELKYTEITYPQGAGTFNELLWGPYVKAGIRYSF